MYDDWKINWFNIQAVPKVLGIGGSVYFKGNEKQ